MKKKAKSANRGTKMKKLKVLKIKTLARKATGRRT
jgi:hypothetical protein